MSDGNAINDPELYRKLREPFESIDEWKEACRTFYEGVRKLREECGLPDLLIVISACIALEGLGTEMMTLQECGDTFKQEAMAAWAFGRCQEEREAIIAKLLAKTTGKKKDKGLFD